MNSLLFLSAGRSLLSGSQSDLPTDVHFFEFVPFLFVLCFVWRVVSKNFAVLGLEGL